MRVILTGAAITVLVVLIFAVRPAPVEDLDDAMCDIFTRWAGPGNPSGQVAIVEVDDASLAALGRWPWPRNLIASVVRRILDAGAGTVVLDTVFDSEERGNDQVLADVLRAHPVAIGYAFRFDGVSSSPANCDLRPLQAAVAGPEASWSTGFFHPSGVLCDVPEISHAASYEGFMNATADNDGKVRSLPIAMEYGSQSYPSLALAAVTSFRHAPPMQLRLGSHEAAWLRIGDRMEPLEGRSALRLRFRGPRRTFPYISAARLLSTGAPSENLRGKIVIVGVSALALSNPVSTSEDPQFPDVEIQATAIDNLLQGDSFHRSGLIHLWELLFALFAGVTATFLLTRRPARQSALLIVLAIAVAWLGCFALAPATGLLFSPFPATAVLACTFPAVTLLNYRREKLRADRSEAQLAAERETAEAVLRESESRYRRLVENIYDAIIVDDADGLLTFANSRFREWFGLEGKDIHGISLENYVAPEYRAELREWRIKRASKEAVADFREFEGVCADGSRIWIEALATNIVEGDRTIGTQWVLRDVTARKHIESKYLQAQKMEIVGQLAGGVAHDFNNLLQVINGYADMLLRSPSDEEACRHGLEEILAAGDRASELTRKLLAFSRKEAVRPTVLNLNGVVADAAKMCARLIGEDVELSTRLSPEPGYVLADSGQLHQILMNLLVNARDAMPRGGQVLIETRNIEPGDEFRRQHPDFPPGPLVCLGVTDTGSGMSDDVKRHLFEPFFTTKEPGKGTGLGLATVYGIVAQSGGRIEVTTALGQGTSFHIYFPRVPGQPLEPPSSDGPPAANDTTGTVLLVEDQESVRVFLRAVLEKSGYRVLEAAHGAAALAAAKEFDGPIDLLVTDLIMPMMNGEELAEHLLRDRPRTKVLFMSGYAKENIGGRGIDAPGLIYLQKPFGPGQFIAKVREALEL
jgi:PAS domain S-box-containing protein